MKRRHDHDRRRLSQEQITATLPGARLGTDGPRHLALYLAVHPHRRVEPRTCCFPIELRFYYALCRWRNGIVIISASAFAASQSTPGAMQAPRRIGFRRVAESNAESRGTKVTLLCTSKYARNYRSSKVAHVRQSGYTLRVYFCVLCRVACGVRTSEYRSPRPTDIASSDADANKYSRTDTDTGSRGDRADEFEL